MTSSSLLVMKALLAFWAAAALLSHIEFVHQHPQVPIWVNPILLCTPGLCFPGLRRYTWSLLNFMTRFQPMQIFMQSSIKWTLPNTPFQSVHFPTQLASSENFIRVHSILLYRSLTKLLNSIGPNINPWRIPSVTGCQFEKGIFTTSLWNILDQFFDSDL